MYQQDFQEKRDDSKSESFCLESQLLMQLNEQHIATCPSCLYTEEENNFIFTKKQELSLYLYIPLLCAFGFMKFVWS